MAGGESSDAATMDLSRPVSMAAGSALGTGRMRLGSAQHLPDPAAGRDHMHPPRADVGRVQEAFPPQPLVHAVTVADPGDLPTFRYHPDPVATESLVASEGSCAVCGAARGFLYDGPFYAVERPAQICPWCIADGSAAARFDGSFTDLGGVGWVDVPDDLKLEVVRRTPGFRGWQQEMWMAHCAEPAVFLGRAGARELAGLGLQAVEAIRAEHRGSGWDEAEIDRYVSYLDRDGEPTAYVFRCSRCGEYMGYTDSG